jgi:hypothetical protein
MATPRLTRLVLVCLALLCITAVSASAGNIYTTAASDGEIHRHSDTMHPELTYSAVDPSGSTALAYYHTDAVCDLYWAVLQFPVASLAGTTLAPNSAKLHVYCCLGGYSGVPPTGDLLGFTSDGGGVLATDQDYGSHVAYVPVPSDYAWREVDVTTDLQRQINAGYNWAGYTLSMRDFYYQYYYYDCGVWVATYEDATHRPYLEVVPEPSSLMVLAGGLLSLGGLIRRRR